MLQAVAGRQFGQYVGSENRTVDIGQRDTWANRLLDKIREWKVQTKAGEAVLLSMTMIALMRNLDHGAGRI